MMKNKIPCPLCSNKRLIDINNYLKCDIEIKCNRCKNIINIFDDNGEIKTKK